MATTPKVSPGRTKRRSLAFGRNLIVLALLILPPGPWSAVRGAPTLPRPGGEAEIINASLRTVGRATSDPDYRDQWYGFAVRYRYTVRGKEYFGGRVARHDFGLQNSAGTQKMRAPHPIGSTVQVAYDPKDVGSACLEQGPSSFSLILVAIGTVIGLAAFWIRSLARHGIGRMA